ncbi:MAG: hypothetical protein ACI8W8_005108 [Rhodothermales bacterium]|jgi:hypothetical protein
MIRELRKNKLVKISFDLRITVISLLLMMVLTTWGTLYQKGFGLYAAQERFFFSWWVWIGDVFPIPGGQTLMWVLFINLSGSAIFRYGFRWNQAGILLIHYGLMFLFVGSFITYYYAIESNLALEEGESSNVASHYHEWEVAVWPKTDGDTRDVSAHSVRENLKGQTLDFSQAGISVVVDEYFGNCDNTETGELSGGDRKNGREGAFKALTKMKPDTEPERNLPGGMFDVNGEKLLLYGAINAAVEVEVGDKTYELQLRRRRIPLPFVVTLKDFVKEEHAGTTMAKNYESTVHLSYEIERDVRIFMNNPLRYGTFTFYQSSFSQTQAGGEISVFAVVDNSGRLIPYISSGIIFGGLLIHFIVMFVQRATPRIRRRLEA